MASNTTLSIMKPVARCITLMHLTLLFAATSIAVAKPLTTECSLSKIAVASGMTRTEVEIQIAKAIGTPSNYGAYANNHTGGTVEYRQNQCVLEVKYNAGAPTDTADLNASGQDPASALER